MPDPDSSGEVLGDGWADVLTEGARLKLLLGVAAADGDSDAASDNDKDIDAESDKDGATYRRRER